MNRAHNFNPGPAALPLEVLQKVQSELLDFAGTGMSILEVSHRSKDYEAVHNAAQSLMRELLGIPENYHILFLGGGASLQFSMVPMNLLGPVVSADYVITGAWSQKACKEAKLVGNPRIAATTEEDGKFTRIPKQEELQLDPQARYVHITSNNTIFGTQWHTFPNTGSVPIVADMSSDFLWRPFDIKPFGLIYGGAQKNLGPAGSRWSSSAMTSLPSAAKTFPSSCVSKPTPRTIRCTTPHRFLPFTSSSWFWNGSRKRAAWPGWSKKTGPKPREFTGSLTPTPSFTALRWPRTPVPL
jgi:phosphoserine aminotransferase